MRTGLIYLSLFGSLLVFSQTYDWFDALVMFSLFGVVPGVNDPLTADQMMVFYYILIGALVLLFNRGLLLGASKLLFNRRRNAA